MAIGDSTREDYQNVGFGTTAVVVPLTLRVTPAADIPLGMAAQGSPQLPIQRVCEAGFRMSDILSASRERSGFTTISQHYYDRCVGCRVQ